MNNATSVTTRFFGLCCHKLPWLTTSQLLRTVASTYRLSANSSVQNQTPRISSHLLLLPRRNFTTTPRNNVKPSPILQKLKQYDQSKELGLSFQKEPLEEADIARIFGEVYPESELGNRILKVLHARRVDGTLDIPFDEELASVFDTHPEAVEDGLQWLRVAYPIDEDAAISGRFVREESARDQEHPSALTERGQRLGLLKYQEAMHVEWEPEPAPEPENSIAPLPQQAKDEPEYIGPQSGRYYAQLSEKEGDVFGRSKIEEIKAENEAKWQEQEEKLHADIDKSMTEAQAKHEERSQALAPRPEQGVEVSDGQLPVRPPNEFEKWIIRAQRSASSKLTLEDPEVARLTTARRILPSLLFVMATCALICLWAAYWEPPRRSERMFPNTSLAYATVGGLLATNILVFLLWKFPPTIGLLNKYFIVTPAYPRMFSMLGNIFSHQSSRHLLANMVGLVVFGPRLHEDVGRANFIALWLCSGLIGSVVSLGSFAMRGILMTSSLGSSGCNWGIVGAYLWLHKDDHFSFILLPEEWKSTFEARGATLLPIFVVLDVVMALRSRQIDVAAHLTGMVVGVSYAEWWRTQREAYMNKVRSFTKS